MQMGEEARSHICGHVRINFQADGAPLLLPLLQTVLNQLHQVGGFGVQGTEVSTPRHPKGKRSLHVKTWKQARQMRRNDLLQR
jgi:hypothetical protein